MSVRRLRGYAGILVALAAIGLAGGVVYLSRDWNPYGKRPFDSHTWRAASIMPDGACPEGNPRRGMVRDLRDNYLH